ncbi:hypothetical protein [Methylorubrum salsuginis]|uniref:Uncharacterized protein n=1 Tax=Methylorubrum salsuginis TaxID=414703 RepID=A0A1I4ECZ4_9HYPH|nr:hypothetical protein [Methylorubrum salsuginis]SFL03123.1 hypothetical protein SAMN04488125_107203 [Methylorubrum salsuginis]
MSILTDGTHENIVLAQNVNGRLRAEARMLSARAFLLRATGAGVFLALAGAGLGAASYGYAYMNQFDTAAEKIAGAMQAALANVTLKTQGEVTLTDNVLKLEQPPAPQSAVAEVAAQAKEKEGGFDTTTTYTLFKSVAYLNGDVITGWNYLKNSKVPESQYCYYRAENSIFSTEVKQINIALNGQLAKQVGNEYNLEEMSKRCIWFNGGKPTGSGKSADAAKR